MEQIFTNETLDVDALPKYETVSFQGLDKRYKKIMWWNFWLSTLIFAIIVSVPAMSIFWGDWQLVLFYIPVLLIQGLNFVLMNKSFNSKKYAIRQLDIIFKSGFINQQSTIVPFNKIQHVSMHESWLARKYQLARLELYTTGDSLSIPGLPIGTAQNIKTLILDKISNTEDVDIPSLEIDLDNNESSLSTTGTQPLSSDHHFHEPSN